MCRYLYLFKYLFFSLLYIYLEMDLLGSMVILCVSFWGPAILFSIGAEPFYIPTAGYKGSSSFLAEAAGYFLFLFFFFFIVAILLGE